MYCDWNRDGWSVRTDPATLDIDTIHAFLTKAHWSRGISRSKVDQAIANSLNFGVFAPDGRQVGYGRVVSDQTTFAYVSDVFVLDGFRGQGLGSWLMGCILGHPALQGLRRWQLNTRTAQALYARFGFVNPPEPSWVMIKLDPSAYRTSPSANRTLERAS